MKPVDDASAVDQIAIIDGEPFQKEVKIFQSSGEWIKIYHIEDPGNPVNLVAANRHWVFQDTVIFDEALADLLSMINSKNGCSWEERVDDIETKPYENSFTTIERLDAIQINILPSPPQYYQVELKTENESTEITCKDGMVISTPSAYSKCNDDGVLLTSFVPESFVITIELLPSEEIVYQSKVIPQYEEFVYDECKRASLFGEIQVMLTQE